jgi:CAAX prenyl protease-like protein
LALLVGVVGALAWIGICKLGLEQQLSTLVGWGETGARSRYDPFTQLSGAPGAAWGFLAVRMVGLVAVVPVIEEFFLRGFVMRFCVHADWWEVPLGKVNAAAVVAGTVVPMLMHPGELLAAATWFSLITWLMIHKRNIWDCVAAHAVTNLLLGLFAVFSSDWSLL